MQERYLLLLLRLIHAKADVDVLLRRGLRYSQIASLVSDAIEKGYAHIDDKMLTLTELGLTRLKTGKLGIKNRTDGGWIEFEYESKTRKLPLNSIYLPKIENSYFD